MRKIVQILLCFVLLVSLSGCSKNKWEETYHLTYFYLEDCVNCQHFKEAVLPLIEKEFKEHMIIESYNMDDEDAAGKNLAIYDMHIQQIIDFNQEDYEIYPLIFLEDYVAILGAANEKDFVQTLKNAILNRPLGKPHEIQTYYYLKNGKIKK